jgi:DNA-binding NtrC family response regulator
VQGAIRTRNPVLIVGETGTGKNDLARMIHYNSPWAARSLLFMDCSSVPADLVEAQLFGEEIKVGTKRLALDHPGLLERSHLGTLVLSHFETLSPAAQARIARVITEEKSQRQGGQRFYPASVRILITGVPGEVQKAIDSGRFHPSIVDGIRENTIKIPPLRERREDIPVLVMASLKDLEARYGRKAQGVTPEVLERLSKLPFHGNARELKELVEREFFPEPRQGAA